MRKTRFPHHMNIHKGATYEVQRICDGGTPVDLERVILMRTWTMLFVKSIDRMVCVSGTPTVIHRWSKYLAVVTAVRVLADSGHPKFSRSSRFRHLFSIRLGNKFAVEKPASSAWF